MAGTRVLVLLAALLPPALGVEVCICVEDWTSTHRSKLALYDAPGGDYEYRGVIEGIMGSYYKPCVCDEVIRMEIEMIVTSAELYAEANETIVEANITTTLMDMSPSFEASAKQELGSRMDKVLVLKQAKVAPDKVKFDLEFILRGTNETMANSMEEVLISETLQPSSGLSELQFLGPFTVSGMKVVKCSSNPPAAPTGLTRTWSNMLMPPTKAIYTCPDGQYVLPLGEGVSKCQHDSLTWTTFSTLTCSAGCGQDPPLLPLHAAYNWDNTTRTIDTSVEYFCQYGYRSGDGKNTTSNCTAGEWTELAKTYFCSEKPCMDKIPQVPAHAATDFKENRRIAKTIIKYWCTKGYRATKGQNTTVTCGLGLWSSLKPGWKCTNVLALNRADTLKGEMDVPDNELTKAEKLRKLEMAEEPFYFWMVTLPSIIGLILSMMFCLCCTRTDSPIFNICNGHKSSTPGYENYMGKFRNN